MFNDLITVAVRPRWYFSVHYAAPATVCGTMDDTGICNLLIRRRSGSICRLKHELNGSATLSQTERLDREGRPHLSDNAVGPRQHVGGFVRPICLAAFILITNSNCFGCSSGISAGLAPLRILSTCAAARRYKASNSAP